MEVPDIRSQNTPRLLITVTLGIAAILGFLTISQQGGAARLWAAACLAGGAIVGFLFGIPRTLQSQQPVSNPHSGSGAEAAKAESQASYAQLVNTNLEQISDWLTKILVGLGLTQLDRAPGKIHDAAVYISSGMANPQTAAVVVSALIVYFTIIGFFGGYLVTRLVLAPAFRAADVGLADRIGRIEIRVAETAGQVSQTADEIKLYSDMNRLIVSSLQDLARKEVPPSSMEENIRGLEPFAKQYPTHRTVYIVLGRLYDSLKQYDNSIRLLTAFLDQKARQGQTSDKDVADVLYNRACTYSLKSATVEGDERDRFRSLALNDLRTSISLSAENAIDAATDSDFNPIRNLDEFKLLVRS